MPTLGNLIDTVLDEMNLSMSGDEDNHLLQAISALEERMGEDEATAFMDSEHFENLLKAYAPT
jgi:hypothetical protein